MVSIEFGTDCRAFQSCCDKSTGKILLAKSSKKFKRICVRKCFVLEIQGVQISKCKFNVSTRT